MQNALSRVPESRGQKVYLIQAKKLSLFEKGKNAECSI